jgi:hypothetical protein
MATSAGQQQPQSGPVPAVFENLLVQDFSQCYQQLREYNAGARRILELGVGGTTTVVAAYAALVGKFGPTKPVMLIGATLLFLAGTGGAILLVSLARNRVYFVTVARYINEIRSAYLEHAPGGVTNRAGIWANPSKPDLYDSASTQTTEISFFSVFVSVLFAGFFATIYPLAVPGYTSHYSAGVGLASAVGIFFLINVSVRLFWRKQEKHRSS